MNIKLGYIGNVFYSNRSFDKQKSYLQGKDVQISPSSGGKTFYDCALCTELGEMQ